MAKYGFWFPKYGNPPQTRVHVLAKVDRNPFLSTSSCYTGVKINPRPRRLDIAGDDKVFCTGHPPGKWIFQFILSVINATKSLKCN